ncbi:MAG: LPS export ABC transporter periplasmic protein LptC [Acidobacteria bacterium]|nr:LPS export ABC transporter periplasmic protein LptC [Acidobacteriota bacterium]
MIAVLVIGFIGVLVMTLRQDRGKPQPAPPLPRIDPKSTAETQGGGTHRVTDPSGKERWRIDFGTHVALPDGRSRLTDGVTAVINRDNGPLNLEADEADVTQKEGSSEPRQAVFKGNVRLTGGGGLEVTTAEATYSGETDVVTIPGAVEFTKGRMKGSGIGATYDQSRDVLWILDQARIAVAPDKTGAGGLNAVATKAGLARAEHYMVLDGAARIEGEGRVTEANLVTMRLTPDDERIQVLELRGNSRITGRSGGPQSMSARDIDLTYGPDGRTLQFAKLVETAVLQLAGAGAGGKRIAGDTIDLTMAPDGATVTNLVANGRVQVDLPAEAGGPAKRIRSSTLTSVGAPGSGLQNAQFGGGVEYRETRPATKGAAALDRSARSLTLSLDTKPGLGALEKADFRGNVNFADGPDFKAEGPQGIYHIVGDRLELRPLEGEPGPSPRVSDGKISVQARTIVMALATRDMTADTKVKSTILPQKTKSAPGGNARIPSMLAPDKEVNVTANRLDYTQTGATYSGNATLWQDKTTIRGATILLEEKSGNLTASGGATTVFFLEEADEKTGARRQVQSTGKAETFVYNDAKRLATYTDKAQINGAQGNVTGDRIELFLKPGVNELERAVAYGANGSVVVREGQRLGKGDHLTYTAADDNYMMTGRPVEVIEEKNGTCSLTVGAEVTFSRRTETASAKGNAAFPGTMTTLKTCPPELKR